ncbi:hypothetical protein MNBD_NITROSPINAE02-2160 [hydrothermal vent metagenome]|uniref:DUF3108 domain-containing protein n=1 Tax=hydrothermal vent metagenome TaxID=652676 RepID=A0A3B1C7B2_9ZZZZ
MKTSSSRAFIALIITAFISASSGAAIARKGPVLPFKPGEHLVYDISWLGIIAGEAGLHVNRQFIHKGSDVFELSITSRTTGWLRDFYAVNDRTVSLFDINNLYSHRAVIRLREGSHRKDKIIEFDQKRLTVSYKVNDKAAEEFTITPNCQDPLSALFVLRTLKGQINVGQSLSIPLFDSKKNYDLVVKVIKKERLKLPQGMVDTIMVIPKLKTDGVFLRKGSLYIWLTDDEFLTPVKIRSKIAVGSFLASLRTHRGVKINFIPYEKPLKKN